MKNLIVKWNWTYLESWVRSTRQYQVCAANQQISKIWVFFFVQWSNKTQTLAALSIILEFTPCVLTAQLFYQISTKFTANWATFFLSTFFLFFPHTRNRSCKHCLESPLEYRILLNKRTRAEVEIEPLSLSDFTETNCETS